MRWPTDGAELEQVQRELADATPPRFTTPDRDLAIGGVFVCFGRGGTGPGRRSEPGWAGAAITLRSRLVASAAAEGEAGAPYAAGLLALREGSLLESAVRALPDAPDALLVNATGRDHPRRAGLALHLGAILGVPTIGVTHRLLVATGAWPDTHRRGDRAPFRCDEEIVGWWLQTRDGCRPLAVHAAWRTDPGTAVDVVLAAMGAVRTPPPLRHARRLARTMRSRAERSRAINPAGRRSLGSIDSPPAPAPSSEPPPGGPGATPR